jgi:metal-sulfur cluster biosynthetic enzyme
MVVYDEYCNQLLHIALFHSTAVRWEPGNRSMPSDVPVASACCWKGKQPNMSELINANPTIYKVSQEETIEYSLDYNDEEEREVFTPEEVFHYIRKLNDPEHPLTLEQLNVVNLQHIYVNDAKNTVHIQFTPTIPHCSMATLIGLCIRVKLLRSLPSRFKVQIEIYPGSHQSEAAVNKQLNDKERVAAALENTHLLDIVDKCILTSNE